MGTRGFMVNSSGDLFTTAGQLRATGDNGLGVFAAGQDISVADGATLNLSEAPPRR
jgi:hypothetical protein